MKKPLLGNDELIVGEWYAVRENDSKFIDRLRYLGGDFFKYASGRSTSFSVEQATWTRWADFEDFIFSAYKGNMENLRAQTSLPELKSGYWYFVINGFQARPMIYWKGAFQNFTEDAAPEPIVTWEKEHCVWMNYVEFMEQLCCLLDQSEKPESIISSS